jgi:hypothetical protein
VLFDAVKTAAQLDWDDKLYHIIFGSGGLLIGAFIKYGFDWVAGKLWRKTEKAVSMSIAEHKEFKEWKATRKKKKVHHG